MRVTLHHLDSSLCFTDVMIEIRQNPNAFDYKMLHWCRVKKLSALIIESFLNACA